MVARTLTALALVLATPAVAQDDSADLIGDEVTVSEKAAASLEGSWALQIGPATIFRFDMAPVEGKSGEWRGTWSQPGKYASDGDHFSQVSLPAKVSQSMAGLDFLGEIELSFNDPRPNAIPDVFRFRLVDADTAEMEYVGTELKPYILHRVAPGTPLGPFEEGVVYQRTAPGEAKPKEPALPPPDTPPTDINGFRLPPKGTPTR